VIQGKREMDEELIAPGRRSVVFLDDIVDVSHCGADKESKNESRDVMTRSPEVDVDGIEDGKERESPRDAIDNYSFTLREELVYDSTEKKKVNERPDEERPRGWSDVSLLSIVING
jgi:hypothetical protein